MQNTAATLHSFFVILAGFAVIAVLLSAATLLVRRFAPEIMRDDAPLDLFAMSINVGLGLVFSIVGGYVTALLSHHNNPLAHALVLALVVLVLSAVSAMQLRGKQPIFYLLSLTVFPPLAVLSGGLLRLYQLGARW